MLNKNSSQLSALVLVGGFGTRIRQITGPIPKPLVEVFGMPFLYWVLKNLKKNGVTNVYLLSHYGAQYIEAYAKEQAVSDLEVECVVETSPLGTGGSVLDFLSKNPYLSDPFLVLNGDSLLIDYNIDAATNIVTRSCSGLIFGVSMEDASRYGTLEYNNENFLTSFQEKKIGGGVINSGVYLFTRKIFSKIKNEIRPLSLESDIIPLMVSSGEILSVMVEHGPFIDIGTENSLREAESFIKNNLIKLNS